MNQRTTAVMKKCGNQGHLIDFNILNRNDMNKFKVINHDLHFLM